MLIDLTTTVFVAIATWYVCETLLVAYKDWVFNRHHKAMKRACEELGTSLSNMILNKIPDFEEEENTEHD
jgi:hypothetical protein